jgi:hypothetical protein
MSFLDDGYLGAEPGLGKNVLERAAGVFTGALSQAGRDAFKAVAKAENQAAVAVLEAKNKARAEAAAAGVLAAAATKKATAPVADAAAQAFSAAYEAAQKSGKAVGTAAKQAVGTAAKQAAGAVGTAAKQTGIVVTDALKTAAISTVKLISKKGGRVVDEDSGPLALPELNLLGWSVFADPAVSGEPTLNPGTEAETANPAWPGYFATKGGERIGPYTWDRLQSEILKRPAPALDASGTQATWEGWAFWMIPATPGDVSSENWPGFFAEKAGTKTAMGTADAVMKDVQAREAKNAPDQELPQGETNPYLGWALWWRPQEGDAGIFGRKNGVETIHGTADAVALDIQNREKANQPQTPSGMVETYSGQDYNGWQIWTAVAPAGTAIGSTSVFGLQGSTRTQLYRQEDIQQLYLDIQQRSPQQPQHLPDPYQPSPYQPSPYQPSPYQPSPYQPSPYQPSPYQPAPMTGGGGSFVPSSGGFTPSSSGYQEGGFLAPGGLVDRPSDETPSESRRGADEAAEPEFEEVEVEEVEYEEIDELDELDTNAVDGLGASPSLPSAILPLAGVALLWYLVTRK